MPSELKATDFTGAECPFKEVEVALALLSQMRIVVSREADAIRVPRSLQSTEVTGPV